MCGGEGFHSFHTLCLFLNYFQEKNVDGHLSSFFSLQFRSFLFPFKRKFSWYLEMILIVVQGWNLCQSDSNIPPTLVLGKPYVALGSPKKCRPLSKAGVLQPFRGVCKPGPPAQVSLSIPQHPPRLWDSRGIHTVLAGTLGECVVA